MSKIFSIEDYYPTVEARRSLRLRALIGFAFPLSDAGRYFGPPLLMLSPWHHLAVLAFGHPIATGAGEITLHRALEYTWIHSPEFSRITADPLHPPRSARFRFFVFRLRWILDFCTAGVTKRGRIVLLPSPRTLNAIRAHAATIALDRPSVPSRVADKPEPAAEAKPEVLDGPHEVAHRLYNSLRLIPSMTRDEFVRKPYAYRMSAVWRSEFRKFAQARLRKAPNSRVVTSAEMIEAFASWGSYNKVGLIFSAKKGERVIYDIVDALFGVTQSHDIKCERGARRGWRGLALSPASPSGGDQLELSADVPDGSRTTPK